ncbi:CoA transferase [Phytohabitans sp. ZYX-F-186]|uniref:CoA transferase n=1 Tax=Phytohabitans maris TaxID=3071409 RepID=A0ABU0ZUX5_9ACTN|nr:CoA transferase [Phytohabitans sp. ZYX-F-186]MDQ7910844.1 CoA transferase [Phytohabitans sp. ZYX-F-186]
MVEGPVFEGLKVVEFAHVVAGPVAGGLLADLGATVVHVEAPGTGDPTRQLSLAKGGKHVWWSAIGRNKRSVTLDLRSPEGQRVARRLAAWSDVVITNMRVETLERWGLDWASLHAVNDRLVMLQISANGAASTLRNEPGFGKVGEARSGALHLTGHADGPPLAVGYSQADAVTGLMGAFAISAALTRRHEPDFHGEWIDLALFESLYRLIDWQVILYDQLGFVPTRAGNQVEAVPSALINTYRTSDGAWIIVTSGTPKSVRNIAALVGLPVDEYATMDQLVRGRDRLDKALAAWIAGHTAAQTLAEMTRQEVIASRIYSVADIVDDPTYLERDDVISVTDPTLGTVRMHGVVPRLANRPGRVWRTGPDLGQDNDYVYRELVGLTAAELDRLRAAGTV